MLTGDYKFKLIISNFLGAYVKDMENENGEEEPYICIPLKRNGFVMGPTKKVNVYMMMKIPRMPLFNGWTHAIIMQATQATKELIKSMGLSFPVMGNARPVYSDVVSGKRYKKTFVRRIDDDK